ncbi:MAG TPA: hypothetical protein VEG26_03060 [Steroidobacteraceae bacterium]|nr:hypothetical protein [Steroidobacteraceae bacterium]
MSPDLENEDLERRLHGALEAVDPGERFVPGVLARIAAEPAHAQRPPRAAAVVSWLAFGLAASVVVAVLLAHEWQLRRIEEGREARRQLVEALRVTDEKLNLAYRAVNTQQQAAPAEHSGA